MPAPSNMPLQSDMTPPFGMQPQSGMLPLSNMPPPSNMPPLSGMPPQSDTLECKLFSVDRQVSPVSRVYKFIQYMYYERLDLNELLGWWPADSIYYLHLMSFFDILYK